jgi:hypothetical protein
VCFFDSLTKERNLLIEMRRYTRRRVSDGVDVNWEMRTDTTPIQPSSVACDSFGVGRGFFLREEVRKWEEEERKKRREDERKERKKRKRRERRESGERSSPIKNEPTKVQFVYANGFQYLV